MPAWRRFGQLTEKVATICKLRDDPSVTYLLQNEALPAKVKAERALEAAAKFVPGVMAPFSFVEA